MGDANRKNYDVHSFLSDYHCKPSDEYNIGCMDPAAKYKIPDYESFLTVYCNHYYKLAKSSSLKLKQLCFTERPQTIAPLRFDFDIRQHVADRKYDLSTITDILLVINRVLDELFEIEDSVKTCLILEKSDTREDENIYKDGFHIHYPKFYIDKYSDDLIKKKVNSTLELESTISHLINDPEISKFDNENNIFSKSWLLYGSSKSMDSEPYLVTHIFDADINEIDFSTAFEDLSQYFPKKIREDYILPRILSITNFYKYKNQVLRNEFLEQRKRTIHSFSSKKYVDPKRSDAQIMEELAKIKRLKYLDHLADRRAEDYNQWMDVGWTLFGISAGSQEGLDLWIEFSKRSPKFEDGVCEKAWSTMTPRGKTMGSLIFMLQTDDPEFLLTLKKNNAEEQLRKSLVTFTETSVARIIQCFMEKSFVYCKKTWYCFGSTTSWGKYNDKPSHTWKVMQDQVHLRLFIQEDLCKEFEKLREKAMEKTTLDYAKEIRENYSSDEAWEKKDYIDKQAEQNRKHQIKLYNDAIKKLGTTSFVANVVRTCEAYFCDSNFDKERDNNPYLLGCENGVLDLKLKIFREGTPDDKITITTGYDYPTEVDPANVKKIENILKKIFVDDEEREYVKKIMCITMYGRNAAKILPVHYGPTNAGKSAIISLMRFTFGDYSADIKKEKLIRGSVKNSGGPDIEIHRNFGKRFVAAPEMSGKDELEISFYKTISAGSDKTYSRGMHDGEGRDSAITYTMHSQFNEWPKVPGDDDAFWGRVVPIKYSSTFIKPHELKSKPVPKAEEEQYKQKIFKADPTLEQELEKLAPTFLHMLFEMWCNGVCEFFNDPSILEPPDSFKDALLEKRAEFDHVSKFLSECTYFVNIENISEVAKDKNCEAFKENFIYFEDLFSSFKTWFMTTFPSSRLFIDMIQFVSSVKKRLPRYVRIVGNRKQGILGIKEKNDDDDE